MMSVFVNSRPPAGIGWDIWRGVIGLSYLAAAVFNSVYTLPRSSELDEYAEGAWFGFLQDFMWNVFMPNGEVFMTLVIIFEIAAAVLILNRDRFVDVGVIASVGWVLLVLPFLAWPYLLTNLVLAVLQGVLLLRRYEVTIFERLLRRASARRR
jgi:hypothetical protein